MKLASRDVPRWLAKRPAARVILVHGEDRGGVTDLAKEIACAIVPDLDDPFSVALLDADSVRAEPTRLNDELFGLSPLGGPKLVRFRDATDRHTALIEALLAGPAPPAGNVVLVEAGELAYRSSLRKLAEGHAAAAAILCGGETGADTEALIRETLKSEGLRIAPDAVDALSRRLAGDRAMLRRALEVLALYKREDRETEISAADVLATTGDSESLGIEAVMDALLTGSRAAIDRALAKALEAGTSPVGIVRAALRTFQRIELVSGLMERGVTPDQALAGLFPPVPFPAKSAFIAACRCWPGEAARRALRLLDDAEAQCKTTGLPEAVVCSEALLRLPGLSNRAA